MKEVWYLLYTYRTAASTVLFKVTSLYLIEFTEGAPFSLNTQKGWEGGEGEREEESKGWEGLQDRFGNESPLRSRV